MWPFLCTVGLILWMGGVSKARGHSVLGGVYAEPAVGDYLVGGFHLFFSVVTNSCKTIAGE